jgi:methionyl-tRNA formyltransferase
VLEAPVHGLINVHASLLPRHRGAAPVHRAVMAGDAETGISIMRVVQALDAGGVYAVARRPIGADETSVDVEADLARMGASLLIEVIADLVAGRISAVPQDDAASSYAARLEKDEGLIDWTASASEIHNKVRGLQPWPLAWTYLGGRRLIVLRTRLGDRAAGSFAPATICAVTRSTVSVATGSGVVDILMVQPEGRRAMAICDFVAGHKLAPGARFDPAPPGSTR